jgi:hypothetical protein
MEIFRAHYRSGDSISLVTYRTGTKDAPDIRPDNPAFFYIRYPAGYQIVMPDIRPDIQ